MPGVGESTPIVAEIQGATPRWPQGALMSGVDRVLFSIGEEEAKIKIDIKSDLGCRGSASKIAGW